jgi:hypothetical protein
VASTPTLSVYFETAVEGKLLFDNGNGGVRRARDFSLIFRCFSLNPEKSYFIFIAFLCFFVGFYHENEYLGT